MRAWKYLQMIEEWSSSPMLRRTIFEPQTGIETTSFHTSTYRQHQCQRDVPRSHLHPLVKKITGHWHAHEKFTFRIICCMSLYIAKSPRLQITYIFVHVEQRTLLCQKSRGQDTDVSSESSSSKQMKSFSSERQYLVPEIFDRVLPSSFLYFTELYFVPWRHVLCCSV